MTDYLAYPSPVSVIFTDSIPIFAVFFKFLSSILPDSFQYFGFWGLLCFMLQGLVAAKIVRHYTDKKTFVILSSLIVVYMPVMIMRMFGHTALAGQWIILLSLEPVFCYGEYKNNSRKLVGRVMSIGLLASAIHIYFLLMCGICIIGICIISILDLKEIRVAMFVLVGYIVSAVFTVALLGGFTSGVHAQEGGLGLYSFNLNALFNPSNTLFNPVGGWSCIFPKLSELEGAGQYEGFAYLGGGCIVMLFVAIISLLKSRNVGIDIIKYWKIIVALIFVVILSIMVAASPKITFGNNVILEVKLPELFINILSVFRASGRIVWVAIYIIVLGCIIVIIKKNNIQTTLICLTVVLIFQIYDMHLVITDKKEYFNKVVEYDSPLKNQDFWTCVKDLPVEHYVFTDRTICDAYLYAFTNEALNLNRTVSSFYFARSLDEKLDKNLSEYLNNLSERNLYIFCDSNKGLCYKYNLHYYDVDGVIVGYVNSIGSFVEMEKNEFF